MSKVKFRLGVLLTLILSTIFIVMVIAGPAVSNDDYSLTSRGVIVKFKEGVTPTEALAKILPEATIVEKNKGLGFNKINLSPTTDVKAALGKLKKSSKVEYAESDYIYNAMFYPNDPLYSEQWGLSRINAEQAWELNRGSMFISVAVVDTGADLQHPDLAGKLLPGYNAIQNNSNTQDDEGHGTHVAGIVGAIVNNSLGVAGLGGDVKVLPVKVLDSRGSGYVSDIAEGIIWAADHGVKIINLSLGGSTYSTTLANAVNYAYAKGTLIVAAAGNSGREEISYPAGYPHVLGVSATGKSDELAYFSSYGSHVDLSAPGVSILSTYWSPLQGSKYEYLHGTSMATPFVAGLGALIAAQYPDYNNDQIERALTASTMDLGTTGWDKYYGYGRIDAYRAVNLIFDTIAPGISNVYDTPDPFRLNKKSCSIYYTINEGSKVTVEVKDSMGSTVKVLEANVLKAKGSYQVKWDGKNNYGSTVLPALYNYEIKAIDVSGNSGTADGTIQVTN